MNFKTLFYCFLLAITLLSFQTKPATYHSQENLFGKVKSITIFTYHATEKDGKLEKGDFANPYKETIKYNFKGNRISETEYASTGGIENRIIYKYNKRGKRIETIAFNNGVEFYERTTHKYDSKGNQVKENSYYPSGKLKIRIFYKFSVLDSLGGKGRPIILNFYEPEIRGNQIEASLYDEEGQFYRRFTYAYDAKGTLIEENTYDYDGSLYHRSLYTNDDKGNPVKVKAYKGDGTSDYSWNYQYEYDKKGNWIKKQCFGEVIPSYIAERKIKYY